MVRRPVVCGRLLTVAGDAGDLYLSELQDGRVFEDDVIALLSRLVGEDWVSLDVGANVGLEALALSVLTPRGRVHAFEPVPRTVEHLRQNIARNARGNVEIHPVAVGARTAELEFFDNTEFAAGSHVLDRSEALLRGHLSADRPAEAFIRVHCTTLDEFVSASALSRLDLVKIDAEGYDLDVLAGAVAVLERFRPCVIMEFASFALAMHRSMLPAEALATVRRTFDRVFVVEAGGGHLREIASDSDAFAFLYENANSHPVQDLFCAFDGSPALEAALSGERVHDRVGSLERRVAELEETIEAMAAETAAATADRERAVSERERLEHSLSWRVTAPLRSLHTRMRQRAERERREATANRA